MYGKDGIAYQVQENKTNVVITTGHLEKIIKEVVNDYTELAKEELRGMKTNELLSLISAKNSQWSGGYSISNMLEQIIRVLAIEEIRKD